MNAESTDRIPPPIFFSPDLNYFHYISNQWIPKTSLNKTNYHIQYLLKELDKVACWPNHCQQDGIGHMLFFGPKKQTMFPWAQCEEDIYNSANKWFIASKNVVVKAS